MRMSETITELATALSKAQGQIDDATKGSVNPAFRSRYADIAAVRAAIREPLAVNDLCLVQFPRTVDGGIEVETMILHKSGEYMAETLKMPLSKHDAQGVGSAITYARRYAIMSMLALASEDDDGNAASANVKPEKLNPEKTKELLEQGSGEALNGLNNLRAWYAALTDSEKKAIGKQELDKFVEAAKKADAAAAGETK